MNPYLNQFNQLNFDHITKHPNILIAAAFWDEERFQAACLCYKYMRAIDDLVDCHKPVHVLISESDKKLFTHTVKNWVDLAREAKNSQVPEEELLQTIRKFHIPMWPLEAFAQSMIYDINHNGFASIADFIHYSQGASVAPASIFMHLCGVTKQNGKYLPPAFDVKAVATPCAIFSYLVHIIRDFQKDQQENLNYFAEEVIVKNGLTTAALRQIADGGEIPQGFREMIREYYNLAEEYRQKTAAIIQKIGPTLEPPYRLSLQIIFNLYLLVFEKIDVENGRFTARELTPTPEETKQRVYETILNFKN
ncbi:MAG TPA: squalene/phytoene synthase family protein [Prolixibacteraceae bacterium]|nr:squalene/phytoene synthase family protein [Prolixibacteraceae bacterium]